MSSAAVQVPPDQWSEWKQVATVIVAKARLAGTLTAIGLAVAIIAAAFVAIGVDGLLPALIYGPLVGLAVRGSVARGLQWYEFRQTAGQIRALTVPMFAPRISTQDAFSLVSHDVWIVDGATIVRATHSAQGIELKSESVEWPRRTLWETVGSWGSTGATPSA